MPSAATLEQVECARACCNVAIARATPVLVVRVGAPTSLLDSHSSCEWAYHQNRTKVGSRRGPNAKIGLDAKSRLLALKLPDARPGRYLPRRLCSPPGAPSATRTVTTSCTCTFHTYTRASARVSATIQPRKPPKRLDQCRPAAVRQRGPLPRRMRALSTATARAWRAQPPHQAALRRPRACGSSGSRLRPTSQRKEVPGGGRNQRAPRAGHGRGRRISVRLTPVVVLQRYSRVRRRDTSRPRPTPAPHRPRRGCCCWARCR